MWSKTLWFMNITQEVNTTSTQNFVLQLLFQKSVLNMNVKLYKYLPSKIKILDHFNHFKKEVKSALLNNSFYRI